MSTSHLLRVESGRRKYLYRIEYIENGVYFIALRSQEGDVLETICRVSNEFDDGVQGVSFDSDAFGKQVVQGLIYSIPICRAISAFHKACISSENNF